eukprot:TRINITY_DN3847_c0_g2_i1.p2 TRINITY_DN3847_c0_g2~~TRINITY_DN3847_c0_g2_i1.p2  ORF type:complete len:367 (+),score=158.42 TRINITY_DN3847_c0_g2_i1:1181-2281(+)
MACCDIGAKRRLAVLEGHLGSAPSLAQGMKSKEFQRFVAFQKLDAHTHHNVEGLTFGKTATECGFDGIMTINADIALDEWPYVAEQKRLAKAVKGNNVHWCTAFTMEGFEEPGWVERTIEGIQQDLAAGATGVKVWKNIGMEERKANGAFIMIDDPLFDPIFRFLADKGVTLVGHCGEPKNCWLPVEQMTVNNDKEYFAANAKYHMYKHPEYPSYQQQIDARDNMLRKNKNLRFMGCHLGSLEWSVAELGKTLDEFSDMSVDFAHRMCHLQYQAKDNREGVREFFMKYQDQLVYGTDLMFFKGDSPQKIRDTCIETWFSDWKFLATDEALSCPEVNGEYRGLALPEYVLRKVYYTNALRWFPTLRK